MGLGLGRLRRERRGRSAACRTSSFLAPGLLAATAMQIGARSRRRSRSSAGSIWSKIYPRDVRDADLAARHRARQPRLDRRAADADRLDLHPGHRRCSAACQSPLIVLAIPAAVLTGMAFAAPIAAFSATQNDAEPVRDDLPVRDHAAVPVLGHVLPDRSLPVALQVARLADAAVPRRRADAGLSLGTIGDDPVATVIHVVYLVGRWPASARWLTIRTVEQPADRADDAAAAGRARVRAIGSRRSLRADRAQPVRLPARLDGPRCRASSSRCSTCSSIGFGLGALIGDDPGPGGQPISYQRSSRPALLAASAMNGAIYERTFNVFFKLKLRQDVRRDAGHAAGAAATSRSARSAGR